MTLRLLWTSLWIGGCTAVSCLLLGWVSAVWIAGAGPKARRVALGLVVVGAALPSFLMVDAWMEILGSGGVWRRWFGWELFSMPSLVWIMVWIHWPLATLLLTSSWSFLDRSVLECDPRVRGMELARRVLLPASRGAVIQAGLLVFGLAMNQFSVPALLQARTLSAAIWIDFNTSYDSGAALLQCLPHWMALLFVAWRLRTARLVGFASDARGVAESLWKRLGPRFVWGCGGLFAGAAGFAVLLPTILVVGSAETWTGIGAVVKANQSLIGRTMFIGSATASLALVLGCLLTRWRGGWLLWAAFWTPGIIIGILFIEVFNRPAFGWFYHSWMVVVLGLALRYSGLAWTAARLGFGRCGGDLFDEFRLAGGRRWEFLVRAQAPLACWSLAAAWYAIYLLTLWDVEVLCILSPPGSQTVSLLVFNLLHYGHTAEVKSLCLILMAVALAPGLALLAVRRLGILAAALLVGCGGPPSGVGNALDSGYFSGVRVIGVRGAGAAQFNKPRSIAVDALGRFYVADMTGRVQRFSERGEYESQWQMPQTELGKPKGMCLDASGSILVIEPHYSRVNHYNEDGTLVKQWGAKGSGLGQFTQPRAVAVNSLGEIYVAEFGEGERVQRFQGAGGVLLGSWGRAGSGPGEFSRPEGIAVDSKDRVYVADSCNHRVQVFDREGVFLRSFGKPGAGPGEMSYPYDIQIDRNGQVYVCEFGNSRVQVFDEQGSVMGVLGGPGDEPGRFNNPWSIALDPEGNLLVADSGNHRVQKFTRRR